MKVLSYISVFAAFFVLNVFPIQAAPGDLDRGFGIRGIVKTRFTPGSSMNNSFLQSDGKFVIVGSVNGLGTNDDFYILRFNSDGSLDTTFDDDGRAIVAVTPREDGAWGVVVQPDGKILVLGRTRDANANYDFAVVRLNVNGTPDNTFGNNGVVITSTSPGYDNAYGAVIQPDNKIVVCGTATGNSGFVTSTLVRYNPNGTLDTTFDEDGIAINQSVSGLSVAVAIGMQPDGKFVIAGALAGGITFYFGAARYNNDGSIDTSFGNGGTTIVDVRIGTAQQNSAKALAIQPDGKIVLVGNSNSGLATSFDFAATRLNSNGTLDESFGNSGKIVTPLPGNFDDGANDVVLQPDGKIVIGGIGKGGSSDPNFTVIRYNPNGTLDSRFGNNGVAITSITGNSESIAKMKIESDGKIFAAGHMNFEITFVRYQVNGSRESDFDGDKKADISVFRPSNGSWYLQQSSAGFTGLAFGISTDKLVPADYDGDGKTDVAVFRDGTWYLQRSQLGFTGVAFGASEDIPVPADYDGDGKADIAVFRPSNGTWYLLQSTAGFTGVAFGQTGDKPVAADYDGDGKTDVAVFRAGTWYIQRSSLGFTGVAFGESADKPVTADYDGDGKADVAVFRPSNGAWYLLRSQLGFTGITFGFGTDLPVPADYDDDGRTDVAVFRNGTWYLQRSTAGFTGVAFGTATDKPVPNAFIP